MGGKDKKGVLNIEFLIMNLFFFLYEVNDGGALTEIRRG